MVVSIGYMLNNKVNNLIRGMQLQLLDKLNGDIEIGQEPHISITEVFSVDNYHSLEEIINNFGEKISYFNAEIGKIKVIKISNKSDCLSTKYTHAIIIDVLENDNSNIVVCENILSQYEINNNIAKKKFHITVGFINNDNVTNAENFITSINTSDIKIEPLDTLGLFTSAGEEWITIKKLNIHENINSQVVSKEMRIWPEENPAKNGSLKGHCMNND